MLCSIKVNVYFQRSSDTAVLLTKNEIKAVKKLVFKVVRTTMSIQKMNTDFHSCGVDLASVLVWAIREQRLWSSDTDTMEFNIKLDGRPLGGKIKSLETCCMLTFLLKVLIVGLQFILSNFWCNLSGHFTLLVLAITNLCFYFKCGQFIFILKYFAVWVSWCITFDHITCALPLLWSCSFELSWTFWPLL